MCTRSTIVLAIGLALAAVLGCGTTLIVQPDWYDHTGLRLEADTVRVVGRCDASESRSEAVRQADADGRRQISESIQTEIASEASERSFATTGDRLDSRARSIFESATQAVPGPSSPASLGWRFTPLPSSFGGASSTNLAYCSPCRHRSTRMR